MDRFRCARTPKYQYGWVIVVAIEQVLEIPISKRGDVFRDLGKAAIPRKTREQPEKRERPE